jgi:hypothetical protein
MEPVADVDAMVADAVKTVRDRFGADGLRDLVALATAEIKSSERAVADLAAIEEPASRPDQALGAADTQAWIAYTVQEPDAEGDD